MGTLPPVVIDFETEAIQPRPAYPPKPVGVAIFDPLVGYGNYYAWGHPTGNTCRIEEARDALLHFWKDRDLLFHNAKFDLEVAREHLLLPFPPSFHDTLFTLYLVDPHADTLSLKPAAGRWLGEPPTEQEKVRQWLVERGIVRSNDKQWGAQISKADGLVVGEYAMGDVGRTYRLHQKLYPTLDEGMLKAYDRERRLLPILMANEREGMWVNVEGLAKDLKLYEASLKKADDWLRKRLKVKDLNVDADAEVAAALRSSKVVTAFKKTKTGRDSTSKVNLTIGMFSDPEVYRVLGYRNRLQTVLANSMRPWLAQAEADGKIYTEWNQVRSTDTGGFKGTRTGRLSCSRFQNISKAWEGFDQPKGFKPLPLVRRYLLPDPLQTFVHRDYNQQEFRILAHYEDGDLLKAYQENPRIDYHTKMQELIKQVTGTVLERRRTKILNFGINYGMGLGKLADSLGCDVETARTLRMAQRRAAPGVAGLDSALKEQGRSGLPIRTWGGRLYHCEPPKLIESGPRSGEMQSFEYKLLNYLIQGSAADCTKEALIRYHEHPRRKGRFLVTVHDEINVSAADPQAETEVLREAMESIEFDVKMLTDGKMGPNWGDLK